MPDSLGDRMKGYENVNRLYLTRRMPVIIRIDGKAFHTFTKGFKKPFDTILIEAMQETCVSLCEMVMNCKLAYTQSDEISLLLVDYEKLNTQAWFENNLQKIVSVAASAATMAFNKAFFRLVQEYYNQTADAADCQMAEDARQLSIYNQRLDTAMFDARAFAIPKEEVCNYFIWRQQDASKNSIQMLARSIFSHKELHGKRCSEMQEMMFQKGKNWNDLPTTQKRGSCTVKETYDKDGTQRTRWVPDDEIPIFTQNREYIERYVFNEEK